jgi:hypothetical protein
MGTRRLGAHIKRCSVALTVCAVLALALAGQALATGGSLSGTLVYNDMTPASRLLVLVAPANVTGEVTTYETLTNAQGEWSLGSIPPGEYNVLMIVVPASGEHETRTAQTVTLTEGQSLSLGTVDVGAPAVSQAKTAAEIRAEISAELAQVGTLTVIVKTAEGQPADDAMLSIQSASGGSTSTVTSSGVISEKERPGPVTLSVTDTPPDSAAQVSTSAQTTVVANMTTTVTLTLPPASPLALPAGIAAHNGERDLAYLNTERTRWGLSAGLTLNPVWSLGCAAHDAYLADNNRLEHPEDSSLPGASPGGEWAGLHSVLAEGPSWSSEANPWEDAPLHLDSLFDPDLTVVGVDESRNRTCTTTWPGIGAPQQPGGTIITYPGNGTNGFPPSEDASERPFVPGKFVGLPEGTIAGRELFVYEEPGECSALSCAGTTAPSLESATLTGPDGRVEVRTVAGDTPEVGPYLAGAIVIPVKPLAPDTTYTADVTLGPHWGLPAEQHQWTFRTGPANPDGRWPIGDSSRSAGHPTARITKLRIAPTAFSTVPRGHHHAEGALVTYMGATKGPVTFAVYHLIPGVVTGENCLPAKATTAHKRRCTRFTRVYSIKHDDRIGSDSFRLTGRYGHRRLLPGRYELAAIGSPATASFTMTR